MEYTLVLKRFEEVAEKTRMFVFGKPEGFVFQAGQYVALRIDEQRLVEPDIRSGVRSFSIASAPSDEDLAFVMREGITGFKKTMWDLKPGEQLGCTRAVGHCTVPAENDGRTTVILAGGVGIAPARAMLLDASGKGDAKKYALFYANKTLRDAAFHDDLKNLPLVNFRYIWTLSGGEGASTEENEERGYITAEMIRKHLPEWRNAHYYVIGAPVFADAMKALLLGMEIPESEIKIDPFTGITESSQTNKG